MLEKRIIAIGQNEIKYYQSELERKHKKSLLFLNGYSADSVLYEPLLSLLHDKCETIAPSLCGMNYMKNPPTTVKAHAELATAFCEKLKFQPEVILSHSMGHCVAFEMYKGQTQDVKLIGLNPIVPLNYGLLELALRSMPASFQHKTPLGMYLNNTAQNIVATAKLVLHLASYEYKGTVEQPTLIIHGKKDLLFRLTEDKREKLYKNFAKLEIKEPEGLNHLWPVNNVREDAVAMIRQYISMR